MKHTPRKRFGQNFLQDQNIIRKIVVCINPKAGEHLIEIGPGLGALTKPVLDVVKAMDVVEIDKDLIVELEKINGLCVHNIDALAFNLQNVSKNNLRIIGNLPYNISTPLLFHLFKQIHLIKDMHFMLQKEVVDRLAEPVGTKTYGRLSVMAQYYCKVEKLFIVKPGAFYPPPKVDSAIVRLTPREITQPAKNLDTLESVVAQAFQQRRKTLRNTLKPLISAEDLEKIGVDPQIRPEQLTVVDYVKIANTLSN